MKKTLYSLLILLFTAQGICTYGQVDNEFWFVAPEITEGHGIAPGGEPVYFRVSALTLDAQVRIYQPANPAGLDTSFTVPANSTVSFDASPWIDDLENKPGNIVLNKGVHITSNNLITVYYDVDEYWNQDIFALKGGNALGYEFYAPMQNVWDNGTYTPLPYSSVDIVATEDNTTITINPTAELVGGHVAGVPFSITLDRGETFSCLATSQSAAGHLGGTHIVSDKPIAVTTKDDSVAGNVCRDLIGDQTVPMVNAEGSRIVGYEYIVLRGKVNLIDPNSDPPDPDGVPTGERIFVMATEANTNVFINGVLFTAIANPGEQVAYEIRNNSTHVEGDKPIMVFHVSGFGCEMGGAILPTVDGCTGSLEVSFTRSTDRSFYLNIMTIDAAKHAFTMHYEDGSTFIIPDSWFEPVGSTDYVCLKKADKLFANSSGGGVPQGEVVRITNSVSVFHLGLLEGGVTTGCKYGYLSEYSTVRGDVRIVESGSKSAYRCYGASLQLRAYGGISYSWSPSDYLDDPFIATPIASPPPGVHNYDVTIQRGCFPDTTIAVIMGIADEVIALFETDKQDVSSQDTITFENQSIGVDKSSTYNVQWDFDLADPSSTQLNDTSATVQHSYTNTSGTVEQKIIQLIVWNEHSCASETRDTVYVYPDISADFTTNVTEACSLEEIEFQNNSTGAVTYSWDFGDGSPVSHSSSETITHTYSNTGVSDLVYLIQLEVFNEAGYSVTQTREITVHPEIRADFITDVIEGCGPLEVEFTNQSSTAQTFQWEFGDGETIDTRNPVHLFTNSSSPDSKIYDVKLIAIGSGDCKDTSFQSISVHPDLEANFDMDSAICHLTDVPITNKSVGADFYAWDFGDGSLKSTTSDPDIEHYYINVSSSPVTYTVELNVENEEGCSHTLQKEVVVYPESDGGRLKGSAGPITFGSSTGQIYLGAYVGEVVKWQKIVKAGPWVDINNQENNFIDIPASADLWQYRAVVQSGACAETSSDLFSIFVNPKELVILPTPEQTKRVGDPDPEFTYTNSEWDDNSNFTGALNRMSGESPGQYSYTLGDLSAGANYKLSLDGAPKFSIQNTTGLGQKEGAGGLELSIHSTPGYASPIIRYTLPQEGLVSIRVTNMSGQLTDILVNDMREDQGEHILRTEGLNLDPGMYLVSLEYKGQETYLVKTSRLIVAWQ